MTELLQSPNCSPIHFTPLYSTALQSLTQLGQSSHMALQQNHREHHLQHLFYCCVISPHMWHILLLRVYGPLPSNGTTCYNTWTTYTYYTTDDNMQMKHNQCEQRSYNMQEKVVTNLLRVYREGILYFTQKTVALSNLQSCNKYSTSGTTWWLYPVSKFRSWGLLYLALQILYCVIPASPTQQFHANRLHFATKCYFTNSYETFQLLYLILIFK
jgi:hypothetical protein